MILIIYRLENIPTTPLPTLTDDENHTEELMTTRSIKDYLDEDVHLEEESIHFNPQ